MSQKRITLPYLFLLVFISIILTSCGQAGEINVSCDVSDLVDAIDTANNDGITTKLILDPNCTYPITNVDNTDGGAGPNGLPQITTDIKIEGNNAILTKQHAFGNRFFFITNSGNLRLEDITLENGYSFPGDFPNSRGGAIYNDGGALRAERSIFLDNHAPNGDGGAIYNLGVLTLKETLFDINGSYNGGAIYNDGNLGTIAVIEDVTFENNSALENGGAIYNATTEANFMITGSTFYSNSSYQFHGGAIYMEAGDLEIYNSVFLENRSGSSLYPTGDGGAIYSPAGNVTLITSNFIDNKAYGVGGTIYAGPNSDLRLQGSQVEGNRACKGGGGLYLEGDAEIQQSTLKDNRIGGTDGYWGNYDPLTSLGCNNNLGGAIHSTGTLTIDQSLIDGFVSFHGDGDGVYNSGDLTVINSSFHSDCCPTVDAINNQGTAEISFSTIVYSGLINSGTMTVKNIVIAKNTDSCINTGNLVVLGDNVALDPACPFSIIPANHFDLDMSLSLSDNGGPTLTHYVYDDSPLIDMATCLSVAGEQVFQDQRDVYRPNPLTGTHSCDIGAFEKHDFSTPVAPPPPPPSVDEPADCDPFAGLEISVITLGVNPETMVFPVYLRFPDAVPEIGTDGTIPYRGTLGSFESYLANQQGFPDRVYFMFKLTPAALGAALDLDIFKEGCGDTVLTQPRLTVPDIPQGSSEDQPSTTCQKDLGQNDCDDSGGVWFTGVDDPYCLCPE